MRVGAEEQLEQCGVAQHVRLRREHPKPLLECRASGVCEAVELAPPSVLLLVLLEKASACEARGLGVELRVWQRPELSYRSRGRALEVIRGGCCREHGEQSKDDVGGGCQLDLVGHARKT